MSIIDTLKRAFSRRNSVLVDTSSQGLFGGAWCAERRNYASLIWYNLCGILLDLADDVSLRLDESQKSNSDNLYAFAAFKAFFYAWGRVVLQQVKDNGYAVIGWDGSRLWLMDSKEYSTPTEGNVTFVKPLRDGVSAYVMRDPMYIIKGISPLGMCKPWLDFLDDVCNGSATVSKRLGAVVIGSPKTYSGAPTPSVLTDEQKKKIEQETQEGYGALNKQNQIMILPKEMAFQVINLAGLDVKFEQKLRECVLAIADSLPIPANQVALIDANSSKTLSNGSELREGDKAKYKSFRRLFERTFVMLAADMGLKIVYDITGEPKDEAVTPQSAV